MRGLADKIEPVSIPGDGYRHTGQWSLTDAAEVLASDAPAALSTLTRPQRLTVADELAADAAERANAAQVLGSGNDPASGHSRAWQMCEVTRSLRNGQVGPLPEGAAGWLVRSWGPDLGPAERWAARDRLVRIEQLVAATRQGCSGPAIRTNPAAHAASSAGGPGSAPKSKTASVPPDSPSTVTASEPGPGCRSRANPAGGSAARRQRGPAGVPAGGHNGSPGPASITRRLEAATRDSSVSRSSSWSSSEVTWSPFSGSR